MLKVKNADTWKAMSHRYGIFSLFLPTAVFLFAALSSVAAQDTTHVVARGETVYSISRSYRVSPEELMRQNGITDPSKLPVGKTLRIPASGVARSPAETSGGQSGGTGNQAARNQSGTVEYRVERNDTLFGIARTYGISVQTLRDLNGFPPDFSQIKTGQRIKVPGAAASSGETPGGTRTAAEQPPAEEQNPARAVDASLRWPVTPKEIAYMTGKLYGVALTGERAESVKSLIQGTVISAGPYRGFGRVAIVEVTGGYLYVYGGCESLSVKEGDRIGPGMELGKLGMDAVSGKPQLFFMVYRSNTPIDPAKAPRA